MSREGPSITVITKIRCDGCKHLRSEYYCVDYFCNAAGGRAIPGFVASTPSWCPHLAGAERREVNEP